MRSHVTKRSGLPLGLATAIEARVAAVIPMRQERAERLILEMLRDEFGEALQIRGEASIKRACQMVRDWKMTQ